MDAPADKEDVRPYLKVTALLESLSVHVPHVYHSDVARGLLLLEDLGSTPYLQRAAGRRRPGPPLRRCPGGARADPGARRSPLLPSLPLTAAASWRASSP